VFYLLEAYLYITPANPMPAWLFAMEVTLTVLFCVDYLFAFLAAERKVQHVASRESLLDIATILPAITLSRVQFGEAGVSLQFLRVLRMFRAVRLLQAGAGGYHRKSSNPDSSVRRQIVILLFHVVTYLVFSGGLIHALETADPGTYQWPELSPSCNMAVVRVTPPSLRPFECRMELFTCIYFAVITTLTVGYGDVYPARPLGRLITLAIVLPMFVIVPSEVGRLVTLLRSVSKYTKAFSGSVHGHVILCGDVSPSVLFAFLSEWFHPDHGESKMRVVVLHHNEPTNQTKALLDDPRFDQRVQYVKGSPLRNRDLASAAVYDAKAVFVVSTGRSGNPMLSDATSLLTVRIIKTTSPWVPVYCELNVPTSTMHTWADWDHLVCAQDLKYALLSKSAVCPGFSTFIANLLTSSSASQVGGGGEDVEWHD